MSYVSPSSFFRKVPLEDLIYTSCTDPIPQPAAARTPRLYQPSAVHSITCLTPLAGPASGLFSFNFTVATCLFPLGDVPVGYHHRKNHRLNLSAKAKRCRIHLSKRHRFAIANFKYHRLLPPVDKLTSSLLIPALLNNRNADFIVDDSRFLPISNADVIIADHSFLQ
ncbi:hypothetical protein F511_35216 [Dorcoceras hygrometricum]|uniref:Uncharacterized protein n=1 Tax=Dorcoceras hygrometricum TaxID=472368 RepID=A0A2Z7AYV6_9LAMI|nr:hypothetical protein F511_35216 [Dorcoceras hygrometricum]